MIYYLLCISDTKIATSKNEDTMELLSKLEIEKGRVEELEAQVKEYKNIEKIRVSSSHVSEVTRHRRDAGVQYCYVPPGTGWNI